MVPGAIADAVHDFETNLGVARTVVGGTDLTHGLTGGWEGFTLKPGGMVTPTLGNPMSLEISPNSIRSPMLAKCIAEFSEPHRSEVGVAPNTVPSFPCALWSDPSPSRAHHATRPSAGT